MNSTPMRSRCPIARDIADSAIEIIN
jgi:hypothetical protein